MKRNKFVNKIFLFYSILALLLIIFIFLSLQGYFNLKSNTKRYNSNSLDIIDQRLFSVSLEIDNFPRSVGNDVLFLSKLFSLNNLINSKGNKLNELENLKHNFLEFSKENSAYYQLRYIDEFGNEIVRVDFDGNNHYVVLDNKLQNKKERSYFKKTLELDYGEVYISRLDLNMEQGKIENLGTEENSIYVPMLRYATPLFDDKNNSKGIIVSNVYADYFLEDIRRAQRDGEKILLIDQEGYYLGHPNREKEYGFMFDGKNNFYEDYPISKNDLVLDGRERIETENLVFSFRFIYPTATSFEVHSGSEKIFGENPEEKYYWILISVSEKKIINKINEDLKINYLFYLLFYGIVILIIGFLLYFMNFGRNVK